MSADLPRPASAPFPFLNHRTVAEVWAAEAPARARSEMKQVASWVQRLRDKCPRCSTGQRCYEAHAV